MNRYAASYNGNLALDYDPRGNTTQYGDLDLTYDVYGKMVGAEEPAMTAVYLYDASNRRVMSQVNGYATNFVLEGDRVLQEVDGNSAQFTKEYVWGSAIDELVILQLDGEIYHAHADALGSTALLTDATGDIVERYDYNPFGACVATDVNGGGLVGNPYRFTGRRLDSETGLFYYRARYYSTEMGRFLSRDPIGPWGDRGNFGNAYAYAGNNPLTYTDPSGLIGGSLGAHEMRLSDPEGAREYQRQCREVAKHQKDIVENMDTSEAAFAAATVVTGTPGDIVAAGRSGYELVTDPSWGNVLNLGLDIVGLLPIVPALGAIRRAANATDAVHDIENASDGVRALDAGKSAAAADAGKSANNASNAAEGTGSAAAKSTANQEFWTHSTEFNGNKVYQRNDLIDANLVDGRGRTNFDRMQKGLAPIGQDGKSMNLHHMTQTQDGAIAEMTQTFHQQHSSVIHINPNTIPSGIDRAAFDTWRRDYWKNRAHDFQ